MSKKHLSDEPLANGTTTTSLGTSSSANVTEESSGYAGDGSHSLLPSLKPQTKWAAETDTTADTKTDSK